MFDFVSPFVLKWVTVNRIGFRRVLINGDLLRIENSGNCLLPATRYSRSHDDAESEARTDPGSEALCNRAILMPTIGTVRHKFWPRRTRQHVTASDGFL